AWGGLAGVVVLAIAWVIADRAANADVPSLYSRLASMNWLVVVLAALFLGAMSIVGDLTESLVKRSAGITDSSQLLPGHGGVLDRVDALLPTLPLAMMLATLAQKGNNASPSSGPPDRPARTRWTGCRALRPPSRVRPQ